MFVPVPMIPYPIYTHNPIERRRSIEYAQAVYTDKHIEEKLLRMLVKISLIEKKLNSAAITHEEAEELKEKIESIAGKVHSDLMHVDERNSNRQLVELHKSVKQRLKICDEFLADLMKLCQSPKKIDQSDQRANEKQQEPPTDTPRAVALPSEMLKQILDNIPLHKKIWLRLVSRQWRNVIDDEALTGINILPNFHGKQELIINTKQFRQPLKVSDLMAAVGFIRSKHKWYKFGSHHSDSNLLNEHFQKAIEKHRNKKNKHPVSTAENHSIKRPMRP